MNYLLLAFVVQIFGLYGMILLSDYVIGMVSSHRDQPRIRLRRARGVTRR